MGKTILFGLLWFVVIYFVLCVIIGGVAGYSAGSHYPDSSEAGIEAARMAGYRVGRQYGLLILVGAALLSAMGSVAGVLPGTKQRSA
jgi:amino acid transporter